MSLERTANQPADGELLLSRHLDGELNAAEIAEFQDWLRQDSAHINLLVKRAIDHHRIAELARAQTAAAIVELTADVEAGHETADGLSAMNFVIDLALAERRKRDLEDDANRKLAAQQADDARNRQLELSEHAEPDPAQRVIVIPKAIVWLSLAAVIGLVAWVGWPKPETPPVQPPTAEQDDRQDRPAVPQPVYVAWVSDTYEAVWAIRPVGDRLVQGVPVTLLSGYAELVFDDGARTVVQGPAVIEPLGSNALRLASGRLTAEVPESAHGFVVHTPQMLITDLGTAFGVEVAVADEVTEAFVFDGLIEVSSDASSSDTTAQPVIALSGGRGVRGEQGRQIEIQAVNPGRFIRRTETAPYAVEVSDTVCFLENAPRSLMPGEIESDDWLHIMLERTGVRRAPPFSATATRPGIYQSFPDNGQEVELDGPVDSYLAHIDPVGLSKSIVLEGSITFPRPVVAILGSEEQLIQTDRWFARSGVQLQRKPGTQFGLDGADIPGIQPDTVDLIELSADRRTIHFRLHARNPLDEFRVLIEAAEVSP